MEDTREPGPVEVPVARRSLRERAQAPARAVPSHERADRGDQPDLLTQHLIAAGAPALPTGWVYVVRPYTGIGYRHTAVHIRSGRHRVGTGIRRDVELETISDAEVVLAARDAHADALRRIKQGWVRLDDPARGLGPDARLIPRSWGSRILIGLVVGFVAIHLVVLFVLWIVDIVEIDRAEREEAELCRTFAESGQYVAHEVAERCQRYLD
jgi:hypothetical protein